MKYLDHVTNLRRSQLEKEIALTDTEEEAIKLVMNYEVKNSLARTMKKVSTKLNSMSETSGIKRSDCQPAKRQ